MSERVVLGQFLNGACDDSPWHSNPICLSVFFHINVQTIYKSKKLILVSDLYKTDPIGSQASDLNLYHICYVYSFHQRQVIQKN